MTKLQKIMTRAWEIAREAVENFGGKVVEYIAEAMKMAWAEAKEVRYTIEDLMAMGAKRWQKAGYDRLYLNMAGRKLAKLEISRYNTGNISSAFFKGEVISNSSAGRILGSLDKAFIDLTTGKLVYTNYGQRDEIEEVMDELKNNLKLA